MSKVSDVSETRPEPTSLAELHHLDTEEIRKVRAYQWGDGIAINRIIKSIIRLADDEREWQGQDDADPLRGFWYSPCKPILQRAFPEKTADPDYDFSREMTKRLSAVLSEMVKDGEVTYRGLNIYDDSRKRDVRVGTIEDDKILFVEKRGAYRKLDSLAHTYELSVVSGGGWGATACIEDLANKLSERRKAPDGGYQLFVLSDYDPTGFKIAREFSVRSETLGVPIGTVERIGIDPAQLSEEMVEVQRFRPAVETEADERWMAEHAIEGRYGLEIEALSGQDRGGKRLREGVVDALRPYIREEDRIKRQFTVGATRAANNNIREIRDEATAGLAERLREESIAILSDREGVDAVGYGGKVRVTADMDSIEPDDEFLPDPMADDELHDLAADGEPPEIDTEQPKDALREEIKRRIKNGDIPVDELLGFDGGDDA